MKVISRQRLNNCKNKNNLWFIMALLVHLNSILNIKVQRQIGKGDLKEKLVFTKTGSLFYSRESRPEFVFVL